MPTTANPCDSAAMQSGVSHHARKQLATRDFESLGVRCAVLAANRSWTTFALLDDAGPDAARISHDLDVAIVQIWFDDDHGTSVHFHTPDGWRGDLPIEFGGGGKLPPSDRILLDDLVDRGVLTVARRAALARELTRKPSARDAWLAAHGVETTLGVAETTPLPVPCSAAQLAEIVPTAKVVAGNAGKLVRKPTTVRPSKPAKRKEPRSPAPNASVDRGVLKLHTHYWIEIFQMNGWKLYTRYKKHLPAERRREVDQLCNLVALGSEPEKIEHAVEAILMAVWNADDWSAAIRDPRLAADEPLDPDQLADWQRRLAQT